MSVSFDDIEVAGRYYNERKEHEVGHSYDVYILSERGDGGYDAEFDGQSTGPIHRDWWGNPNEWEKVN